MNVYPLLIRWEAATVWTQNSFEAYLRALLATNAYLVPKRLIRGKNDLHKLPGQYSFTALLEGTILC